MRMGQMHLSVLTVKEVYFESLKCSTVYEMDREVENEVYLGL